MSPARPPVPARRLADAVVRRSSGRRFARGARSCPRTLVAALPLLAACGDGSDPAASPAAGGLPVARIAAEDFVGSAACAACHEDQHRRWAGSTHGRAGGEPGPGTVIAPFDGTPIAFRDGTVVPAVDSAGRYLFRVRQDGRPEVAIEVDGVIGGGHLLGGGTQGFVTRLADGTARFLPFDYSRQLDGWFCNTGTRLDRGWAPITAEMALADCGDWPPRRVLGTLQDFSNCQSCHGSQIAARLEPGARFETRWTSLDINCESCHGPARRHVELMTAADAGAAGLADPGAADPADIGLPSRVADGVEESLEVCFQCHAVKDVVQEGHLPGARFADHYALKLPILGGDIYLPDGRVGSFAYQGTHLMSSCYVDGSMTCVSCHEPHGLGYWDVNRAPLASETDDRQCTSCHAAKAAAPERHTFHPPDSPGARCVGCHMPYLQHPGVGGAVPFARSDHTIPVPRPELDARLGLASACRGCHTDVSEFRLQAQVDEWWGATKPLDPASAGLLAVTDAMGPELAARLLLHPDAPGAMPRFQGLAGFLAGWVRPGGGLAGDAAARVNRMAEDPDPDLRALALATLHVADSADGTAAAASGESLAVRRRWAMILGFLSQDAMLGGDLEAAEGLLLRARTVLPGDAGVLRALGSLHHDAGDYSRAISAYAESLAADPLQPAVHVDLGITRTAAGDAAGAIREYQRALSLNPNETLAYLNLGNLQLRSGDLAAAIRSYERATEIGPEFSRAHLNLAIALGRAGRIEEALPRARLSVELAPADQAARAALAQLEAEAARR